MNRDKAIEVLEAHNRWRRHDGDSPAALPHTPAEVGQALDVAVQLLRTDGARLDCHVGRRPTEAEARTAIEAWLDENAPGYPDYSLREDGDEDSAENKCGWAFWIAWQDITSYLHEDLTIEWYGTRWPDSLEYDDETGEWRELPPPNAELTRGEAVALNAGLGGG